MASIKMAYSRPTLREGATGHVGVNAACENGTLAGGGNIGGDAGTCTVGPAAGNFCWDGTGGPWDGTQCFGGSSPGALSYYCTTGSTNQDNYYPSNTCNHGWMRAASGACNHGETQG